MAKKYNLRLTADEVGALAEALKIVRIELLRDKVAGAADTPGTKTARAFCRRIAKELEAAAFEMGARA